MYSVIDGEEKQLRDIPRIIYLPIYVALSPSDLRRCRQGWPEWKEGRLIRNVVCVALLAGIVHLSRSATTRNETGH